MENDVERPVIMSQGFTIDDVSKELREIAGSVNDYSGDDSELEALNVKSSKRLVDFHSVHEYFDSNDQRKSPIVRRHTTPADRTQTTSPKVRRRRNSFIPEILLHSAIIHSDVKKLRKLVETNECDVNLPTVTGLPPLHEAATEGTLECTEALLELGADVMAKSPDGFTPLDAAVLSGNFECAEALIRYGASVESIKHGIKPFRKLSYQC